GRSLPSLKSTCGRTGRGKPAVRRLTLELLEDRTLLSGVFSILDGVTVNERQPAIFTVVLDGPTSGPATILFETHDLTARAGQDYVTTSQTFTFPALGEGQRELRSFFVPTIDDLNVEPDEQFIVAFR